MTGPGAPEGHGGDHPEAPAGAPCVFCSIIAGQRSADWIIRPGDPASGDATTGAVAFLDARPLFKGHVLVVPRAHVPTLPDMAPEGLAPLFGAVQRVARAVEAGLDAHGTFIAMNNKVSQSVPHLHVHVVPRRRKDGLRGFFWPREPYATDAEREEVARRIKAELR